MIEFRFHREVFANGLTLLFHRIPRVPLVSLGAFLLAGKDQNPLTHPGLSSMVVRLLDEGTESLDHREVSRIVEGTGSELAAFSEREISGLCLTLQSADLDLGINLMSDMLRHPTFPDQRFELERHLVMGHIQAMGDDPQLVGSQVLNSLIYRGTPLAEPVLGTLESVATLTREHLLEFYHQKYGPENCIFVAVGDASFDQVRTLAEAAFAEWENPYHELTPAPVLSSQKEPFTRLVAMDKEQVNVFLGHLGITRQNQDFYAAQVMDAILGGGPGFTSRIPRKLRDELGLAYTTYADLTSSSGLCPGRFVAYMGTAPANQDRALQALREVIAEFVASGPDDEELQTARDFLTGNFVFELQSSTAVVRLLLSIEIFGLEPDYFRAYPELVRSVDLEDVARVAGLYLDTLNYSTVVVGPI